VRGVGVDDAGAPDGGRDAAAALLEELVGLGRGGVVSVWGCFFVVFVIAGWRFIGGRERERERERRQSQFERGEREKERGGREVAQRSPRWPPTFFLLSLVLAWQVAASFFLFLPCFSFSLVCSSSPGRAVYTTKLSLERACGPAEGNEKGRRDEGERERASAAADDERKNTAGQI
jgi:hypothetical protein